MVDTEKIFKILEKYNFWDNKNIKFGLIRKEYLENIKDNYEKFVVSLDDVPLGIRNGIKHIPAWQTQYFK